MGKPTENPQHLIEKKEEIMNLKRALAFSSFATALVVGMSGCAAGSNSASGADDSAATTGARTVAQIKESGTIKLGVFSDKAPFGSVDSNGDYVGYDIEYGQALAKDLGVKVEWVPVDAAARVEYLESNKVDVILANFTVTPERAEKVDFADPYMQVSLGVASPADDPVESEEELAKANIIVVKGTTAEAYVDKNLPDAQVTKYEQYTEATSALADGRGNAWLTDNTEALAWTGAHEGFTTSITKLGTPDTIAAAVHKGNSDLLNWLNENLAKLNSEGFFEQAFEDTLVPVYGTDVKPEDLLVQAK